MVIKFNSIKVKSITAKQYKEHLLLEYNDNNFVVQSDWMTLDNYGVPKLDNKFNSTEESRRYLQIPLNNENETFSTFVLQLDEYFSSDYFKQKYFDKKQQKYSYVDIFKTNSNDKYPSSMKLKVMFFDNEIKTEIIKVHDDGTTETKQVANMDDVKKNIPYKCQYRMIFCISKIWFLSKTYGVKMKLLKIQTKYNNAKNDIEFLG